MFFNAKRLKKTDEKYALNCAALLSHPKKGSTPYFAA